MLPGGLFHKEIIADTHLHFYPCYDTDKAFSCLTDRLASFAEGPGIALGFMAERHDCDFHTRMRAGQVKTNGQFKIHTEPDGVSVSVVPTVQSKAKDARSTTSKTGKITLLPGRQIVTRERLEVLALATTDQIPDGLPAAEAIERSLECGAVPVLAWAPGKWFFQRGRIVRELITRFPPEALLIGDTSLRPGIWPEPILMRTARKRGFRVVAGSDPLPFQGEEAVMGSYASCLEGDFDPSDPLASARGLLLTPGTPGYVGRRGGLLSVLRRMWKNARA